MTMPTLFVISQVLYLLKLSAGQGFRKNFQPGNLMIWLGNLIWGHITVPRGKTLTVKRLKRRM